MVLMRKESERKEIIEWLSTVPHRTHHNAAGKDFLPGTGVWLLKKDEFVDWRKSSASSILWLRGIRKCEFSPRPIDTDCYSGVR